MKYEQVKPIDKTRAKKLLASGDREAICRTLVSVAMFESDRRWAQGQCLKFARHDVSFVRGVAATCLGHLARIHGAIDEDEVVPVVLGLLRDSDPDTRGKAQDALSDFSTFLRWNGRKLRKLLAAA
ncbi:MAG TPA: hypothetical protein VHD88_00570 [Pyrinomonadaceae bacterium]|nr:hypothetical protein [Pyrinomonadaceae bacterium]